MDDIIAKINDIIVQINEEEKLDIDFPESYIEDLSKAYITRDLSDDEPMTELMLKLERLLEQ